MGLFTIGKQVILAVMLVIKEFHYVSIQLLEETVLHIRTQRKIQAANEAKCCPTIYYKF